MRAAITLCALTFLLACPQPPTTTPPDSGGVEPDAGTVVDAGPQPVEVEISRVDVWRHDRGEDAVPRDFDDITAFAESNGVLEPLTLHARDAGVVTVERSADARLYLKVPYPGGQANSWQITSETKIDLGRNFAGRYGATAAGTGTRLQVEWSGGGAAAVSVYSVGPRLWKQNAIPKPATGTSPPYSADLDYSTLDDLGVAPALVQSGDRLYFYQFEPASSVNPAGGAVTYYAISNAASVDALQMQDGSSNNVSVTLSQPPLVDLRFTADLSSMRALTGRTFAPGQGNNAQVIVWAEPWDATSNGIAALASVAYAADFPFSAKYRNPFPAEWRSTQYLRWMAVSEDGIEFLALFEDPVVNDATVDWSPRVAPVTDILVDGRDGLAPGTSSLTPTVTWTAPQGGADYYAVRVYDVGSTATEEFFTRDTSVKLPPGILVPGEQWKVGVVAYRTAQPYEDRPTRAVSRAQFNVIGATLTAE